MTKSILDNSWFTIPYLLLLAAGLLYDLYHPLGAELLLFNAYRVEPLNSFFRFFTFLGEANLWIGITVVLLFFRRDYGLVLGGALAFMAPFAWIIKHLIGVPRPGPWLAGNDIEHLVTTVPGVPLLGGFNSMPSGHTMCAFAMCSLVTLMLPRQYRFLGLLLVWTASLIAISRVFLVQHFLRDLMVGSVFGLLISDFVWQVYRTRKANNKK